jgi:protein-tyrosine phosphatase
MFYAKDYYRMIDTHTHILPDVDDGAQTVEEALTMARIAVADGITYLVATPHHRGFSRLAQQDVKRRVVMLQSELDSQNIPLTLIHGYEVRLFSDVFEDWDDGLAGPIGDSRYVLAEPRFHQYDASTESLLFEFIDRGWIPILAHPERIRPIQDDISLVDPVLARGGLIQITADSLVGKNSSRARTTAETMVRHRMVHIIASDAHKPYDRKPILSTARRAAAELVGETEATAMVTTNPLAIINDEPVVTSVIMTNAGSPER